MQVSNPSAPVRFRVAGAFAVAAIAAGLSLPGFVGTANASSTTAAVTASGLPDAPLGARAGAAWLADEATNGEFTNFGVVDSGLTSDAILAYAAAGLGGTAGATATAKLLGSAGEYFNYAGGTQRSAGPLAKLLLISVIQGLGPTGAPGWNLRTELLGVMNTDSSSADFGRFQNRGEADTSNGFSQSLAIIGLLRSGGVPPEAVSFLRQQQCPGGGFRLFFAVGGTCSNSASGDVDTTGLAVQALAAAGAAGSPGATAAANAGLDWLEARQFADGSFGGSGPTPQPNANSTGLAAQALSGGGRTGSAAKAAGYLLGLQLGCADAKIVPGDRGAIGYDTTASTKARTSGLTANSRDQFRRSTAQAVLGLAGNSLVTLTAAAAPTGPTVLDCGGATTVPPTTGTASTSPPTTVDGDSTIPTTAPTSVVPTAPTSVVPTTATPSSTAVPTSVVPTTAATSTTGVTQPSTTADVAVEGITIETGTDTAVGGSSLAITGANALSGVLVGGGAVALGAIALLVRRRTDSR